MEYLIILLLLLIYVVFAVFETLFVSTNRSKIESLQAGGDNRAKKFLKKLENSAMFLTRIQAEATLIAIVIGTYSGFLLVGNLEQLFEKLRDYGDSLYELIIVLSISTITYVLLALGKNVPKAMEFKSPEKGAMRLYPIVSFLSIIMLPFATVMTLLTRMFSALFGVNISEAKIMTQEEIMTLLNESSEQGVLDKEESEMIQDVIDFSDVKANELMTPRKDIIILSLNDTKAKVLEIIEESNFSKYPIIEDSLDEILGVVCVKDILRMIAGNVDFDLRSAADEPLYIPEALQARKILGIFKREKQKFGIVVDEYGSMEGIITLHDLTESVFGDILEEDEIDIPEATLQTDGSYLVQGTMNLNDFMEFIEIEEYDDLKTKDFNTVGGMTTFLLETIPFEGESFSYKNLEIKVVKMDNRRVDKISVKKQDDSTEAID